MRVDPDSDMTWWWLYALRLCVTKINLYFYLTKYRDSIRWWWQVMSSLIWSRVVLIYQLFLALQQEGSRIGFGKKPVAFSQVLIWWETPDQPRVLVIFTFLMSPRDTTGSTHWIWSPLQLDTCWSCWRWWRWRWSSSSSSWSDSVYCWLKISRREATGGVRGLPCMQYHPPGPDRSNIALGNVQIETLGWGSDSSCPPPCPPVHPG